MFLRFLRFVFIIILIASTALADKIEYAKGPLQILTKNGKKNFTVEIADTEEKLENGLMFRKKMPENNGMIFLFKNEQEINMWMKDTYMPLDMIFIKTGGIISKIVKNTEPESIETIPSDEKIIAVLELNAGICDKLGIGNNDKIVFQGLK